MKLVFFFLLISLSAFSQDDECTNKVIKKYRFTHETDSCNIRLSISIWGKITEEDIRNNYQEWIPEQDFNCLVNAVKWNAKYPLIFQVNRMKNEFSKKVISTKYQAFDFDVFRALVYQK